MSIRLGIEASRACGSSKPGRYFGVGYLINRDNQPDTIQKELGPHLPNHIDILKKMHEELTLQEGNKRASLGVLVISRLCRLQGHTYRGKFDVGTLQFNTRLERVSARVYVPEGNRPFPVIPHHVQTVNDSFAVISQGRGYSPESVIALLPTTPREERHCPIEYLVKLASTPDGPDFYAALRPGLQTIVTVPKSN